MSQFIVTTPCGIEKEFDSREKADDGKDTHEGLCPDCSKGDATIQEVETQGEPKETEPVAETETEPSKEINAEPKPEPVESTTESENNHTIVERVDAPDPNKTLPHWMLTEIEHGQDISVDLNKRGTQVVTNALGLTVNAECEIEAQETDYEYCRYRATAETEDGKSFNAVGDAHIEETGNDKWDLERLAETRAKKRCIKWASAGGIAAFEQFGENNER